MLAVYFLQNAHLHREYGVLRPREDVKGEGVWRRSALKITYFKL